MVVIGELNNFNSSIVRLKAEIIGTRQKGKYISIQQCPIKR